MFCMVSHHNSTIIFGIGFFSKENMTFFVWLFSQFLKCMGKHSLTIIADQDPAIKYAIVEVFSLIFHRLCMWHITNKIGEKMVGYTKIRSPWKNFIYSWIIQKVLTSLTTGMWIEENNLEENCWLADMLKLRRSWCPVYLTDYYFC